MDAEKILDLPRHHRALFIGFLLALLTILILADQFLVPLVSEEWQPLLWGYLRSTAAAILTALFVLWIMGSFIPRAESATGLYEIEPINITSEFENLLRNARRWRYKGNFGRYMRGKVLPTLANRQNAHIQACVIDPTDRDLCERHARYRSSINSIDKGRRYDADTVALEVIVTIVHCAWYVANKGVAIDLYLAPTFDPVRIDSNDEAMILTVEDRRRPALKISNDHFTYEHFELQMKYACTQARTVDLRGMREGIAHAAIEEHDVRDLLDRVGLKELCDRLTPTRIVSESRGARNPYED